MDKRDDDKGKKHTMGKDEINVEINKQYRQ